MLSDMTKGPWAVYALRINGKADAILELIEQVQATEPMADHLYLINANGKCPAITGCGPTSRANAQAIAALPELIEALRQSLTGWQNVLEFRLIPERHRDTAQKLADDAQAALTKAGGPQ